MIATIEKLFEKSPIGSVIVRNACVFNPELITSSNDELNMINKLKILVSHLIKLNLIHPQYGNRVVLQCKSFLQNEAKLYHEKFNSFEKSKDRLDEFFLLLHLKCTKIMKSYHQLSKSY